MKKKPFISFKTTALACVTVALFTMAQNAFSPGRKTYCFQFEQSTGDSFAHFTPLVVLPENKRRVHLIYKKKFNRWQKRVRMRIKGFKYRVMDVFPDQVPVLPKRR